MANKRGLGDYRQMQAIKAQKTSPEYFQGEHRGYPLWQKSEENEGTFSPWHNEEETCCSRKASYQSQSLNPYYINQRPGEDEDDEDEDDEDYDEDYDEDEDDEDDNFEDEDDEEDREEEERSSRRGPYYAYSPYTTSPHYDETYMNANQRPTHRNSHHSDRYPQSSKRRAY